MGRLNVSCVLGAKQTGLALWATSNYNALRAVIRGCNPQHLLWLAMLDIPLMLRVSWLVVDRIHPQSNKDVETKATADYKLNDSHGVLGIV